MSSVFLQRSGIAIIQVDVATLYNDNVLSGEHRMARLQFLWDTGATRTTIPKNVLTNQLRYNDEYITKNKLTLSEKEKPFMADGERADVYKLPAPRMSFGGYELQTDYILTSDTITTLSLLLGSDIWNLFRFTFDSEAISDGALYGKMSYELLKSKTKKFINLCESFAYQISDNKAIPKK